ncbi:acc synthase [Aspergillus pseudoustus]|uniref:Acc synthase n=1 Tax=Aspergillus pseudoustus TaxID=1810923 RepID=A0ABR4JNX4_9EURO
MLSNRGNAYAEADLAKGYLQPPKPPFDKNTKKGPVSFSNAENFPMQDIVLEFIRTQVAPVLDRTSLTYDEGPFGPKRLREAMAKLMNRYFNPVLSILSDNIVFTSGVTSLNALCALSLTDPGDGILLGMPIYGSFTGDLSVLSNCKLVYTPFDGLDQFSVGAVSRYEAALLKARDEDGVSIKALLISNPHNPLGRCYPRETLEALLRFCQRYQIHLISDEVYALSVYDDSACFNSALSMDLADIGVDPALVHVLYGMSKDFAASGLRLGCLISRNHRFLQAALSVSRFQWPSGISCGIATAILENEEFVQSFISQSHRLLRSQRDLAAQALEDAGIPYAPGAKLNLSIYRVAGFFLWIDLSKCLDSKILATDGGWAAEADLSRRLREIGVEMASGLAYYNEVPGCFRIIFSVEVDALKEGLSRIVELYRTSRGLP